VPDATGLELVAHDLREQVPGSVTGTQHYRDIATLMVDPVRVIETLAWLRDTPNQSYDFLASLHASDYLPAAPRFGVHYELLNMDRVERLHVKILLEEPEDGSLPALDSCVDLFPTAAFQEREAYDMFGIEFRGHPDLRRILMPEEYEGWPQRRDFPVGGEPVLFTHNEPDTPRWYE
jgi:NADH-quinone oxidoreductase subunit C